MQPNSFQPFSITPQGQAIRRLPSSEFLPEEPTIALRSITPRHHLDSPTDVTELDSFLTEDGSSSPKKLSAQLLIPQSSSSLFKPSATHVMAKSAVKTCPSAITQLSANTETYIFAFLMPVDFVRLSLTSKNWQKVSKQASYYKDLRSFDRQTLLCMSSRDLFVLNPQNNRALTRTLINNLNHQVIKKMMREVWKFDSPQTRQFILQIKTYNSETSLGNRTIPINFERTQLINFTINQNDSGFYGDNPNTDLNTHLKFIFTCAIVKHNASVISFLVSLGFDINQIIGSLGATALHFYAENSDTEGIDLLLQNPTLDINRGDANGRTALHCAAYWNRVNAIAALLQNPATLNLDINTQDQSGATPLHVAMHRGSVEALNALITAGASVTILDNQGNTCLHQSAGKLRSGIMIPLLVQAGAALEAQNTDGQTALHLAALLGDTDAIQALHQAGANLNAENHKGDTPAHAATRVGIVESLTALHAAGANLNAQNRKDGNTPAHIAATNGYIPTLTALETAGIDFHGTKNDNNETPADIILKQNRQASIVDPYMQMIV